MPIGPSGERLPYNGGPAMGAGPGPDLPPMGGPPPGVGPQGDVDSLMSELMQITQRAEQIISQLESQGVNPEQLLGGGPQAGPPVGVPGGMPQMPVAGNTGPPMGGMPQGLIA